jgi:hypothetical protein
MDTIISWWLRKTVLRKSNLNTPQEENGDIFEPFSQVCRWEPSRPLPPWAFPSWYDLPTSKRAEELPLALPQAQIREPVSFLVGFSPLPD